MLHIMASFRSPLLLQAIARGGPPLIASVPMSHLEVLSAPTCYGSTAACSNSRTGDDVDALLHATRPALLCMASRGDGALATWPRWRAPWTATALPRGTMIFSTAPHPE